MMDAVVSESLNIKAGHKRIHSIRTMTANANKSASKPKSNYFSNKIALNGTSCFIIFIPNKFYNKRLIKIVKKFEFYI